MTSGPRRPTPATSPPRSTLTSTQLDGRAVDRPDGPRAERRPERLRRDLLLEQRQPGADAVRAVRPATGPSSAAPTTPGRCPPGTKLQAAAPSAPRSRSCRTGCSGSRPPTPRSAAARRASCPTAPARPTTGPAAPRAAVPPPTYSVGGTVSGLAGTVVLQDNGGDDLSVTANGSFTFATKLADGAAYNVTVKTNPSRPDLHASRTARGTIAAADVTNVAVTCSADGSCRRASDDFNRPDGSLGPNWAAISDGGAVDRLAGGDRHERRRSGHPDRGDVRRATSPRRSRLTSTQLTGGQWVGPAVRVQNGGQNTYLGIYFWNNGSPHAAAVYKRNAGNWTQLGSSYNCGPLPAGTTAEADGGRLHDLLPEDGTDGSPSPTPRISGGAPGIMTYGTAQADNWAGGTPARRPTIHVTYRAPTRTASPRTTSPPPTTDGTAGAAGAAADASRPRACLTTSSIVLPVEAGARHQLRRRDRHAAALDAQNQYNLTIIEPSFGIEPWYADNPNDPNVQYETFMTKRPRAVGDAEPVDDRARAELADRVLEVGHRRTGSDPQASRTSSRSPRPGTSPPTCRPTTSSASSAAGYGTDANFQANYRLTPAFLDAHKAAVPAAATGSGSAATRLSRPTCPTTTRC